MSSRARFEDWAVRDMMSVPVELLQIDPLTGRYYNDTLEHEWQVWDTATAEAILVLRDVRSEWGEPTGATGHDYECAYGGATEALDDAIARIGAA